MAGSGTAHLRQGEALLSVEELVVEFPSGGHGKVHAVSGISFDVLEGEAVGIVGESGCGKSTTAKAVAMHVATAGGRIVFDKQDLTRLSRSSRRRIRSQIQMIFQDPISSLNPRRPVEAQIAEGLRIWSKGSLREQNAKVRQVMELCGLEYLPALKRRRFQFSGGQCQRISIARALVLEPKLLICDEPVSSLDVSVQAQVLNLLLDMRERYGLTMLFISHDLGVVHHLTDRVIVMYLGKICEVGTPEQLYENPRHHYTQMLIDAIPDPDPNAVFPSIPLGDMPSPIAPPSGCRFRTRCPRAEQRCADEEPVIRETTSGHYVACHFPASTRTAQSAGTPEVSTAPSA